MNELSLSEFGLISVEDAAARRNRSIEAVRTWIRAGAIPVLVIGAGRSARFLLRASDVDAFELPARGAPAGNQNAKKKDAPNPKKTRRSARSGK